MSNLRRSYVWPKPWGLVWKCGWWRTRERPVISQAASLGRRVARSINAGVCSGIYLRKPAIRVLGIDIKRTLEKPNAAERRILGGSLNVLHYAAQICLTLWEIQIPRRVQNCPGGSRMNQ